MCVFWLIKNNLNMIKDLQELAANKTCSIRIDKKEPHVTTKNFISFSGDSCQQDEVCDRKGYRTVFWVDKK